MILPVAVLGVKRDSSIAQVSHDLSHTTSAGKELEEELVGAA